MKDVIYYFKFEMGPKHILTDRCRICYSNNEHQLRLIELSDKNDRPNHALRWLSNSCSISTILHRAQRTFKMDIVYALGFFIKQVDIQLTRLLEETLSLMKDVSTVYRREVMSKNDFQTLVANNGGGLHSFSTSLISSMVKIPMCCSFILSLFLSAYTGFLENGCIGSRTIEK